MFQSSKAKLGRSIVQANFNIKIYNSILIELLRAWLKHTQKLFFYFKKFKIKNLFKRFIFKNCIVNLFLIFYLKKKVKYNFVFYFLILVLKKKNTENA